MTEENKLNNNYEMGKKNFRYSDKQGANLEKCSIIVTHITIPNAFWSSIIIIHWTSAKTKQKGRLMYSRQTINKNQQAAVTNRYLFLTEHQQIRLRKMIILKRTQIETADFLEHARPAYE